MIFVINKDACVSCGACASACPNEAIKEGDESYVIDAENCLGCGCCQGECPNDAISASEE